MPRARTFLLSAIGTTAALAWPNGADASEPKRRGPQASVVIGASDCISAAGSCGSKRTGGTEASGAFAIDLGWRIIPYLHIGAGYSLGFFEPTWRLADSRVFTNAYQQGVFAVLRAYVPIWRIDIGLEVSPGYSRQTFVPNQRRGRDFSHGFALRPGLSLDFRILRHLFIGGRVDFILAFHDEECSRRGLRRDCSPPGLPQTPVHQVIGGLHIGANF